MVISLYNQLKVRTAGVEDVRHIQAKSFYYFFDDIDIQLSDSVRFGVAIGFSVYNGRENLSTWMERTDALLYQAKGDKARSALRQLNKEGDDM
ncbi:hypothetical protein CSB45_00975 [candidate division KSB3 bacterium]|uniref:Uncharacterized protein n=1 Tax=candidate division KSB3 bacterium TaxID=2044937 RepID=A0A2G6EAY2_9BACT|nr:MAG: hypothetical protein CSB45_00975 [candidate division KSB3 bacterium]